jgi:hypothetical protein
MSRDDVREQGGRIERSTRLAGGLLLVGALVTLYLVELLLSRAPHRIEVFEGYELAVGVLAPAGAMLIAV